MTVHFVDANWKSAEIIRKAIEKCLIDWGIHIVFSITVDNASSNDLGVQ